MQFGWWLYSWMWFNKQRPFRWRCSKPFIPCKVMETETVPVHSGNFYPEEIELCSLTSPFFLLHQWVASACVCQVDCIQHFHWVEKKNLEVLNRKFSFTLLSYKISFFCLDNIKATLAGYWHEELRLHPTKYCLKLQHIMWRHLLKRKKYLTPSTWYFATKVHQCMEHYAHTYRRLQVNICLSMKQLSCLANAWLDALLWFKVGLFKC